MNDIFDMIEVAICFDCRNNSISCFISVHACISAALFIHRTIRVHDNRLSESMTFRNRKVIRIMGRCALHDRCTKVHIDIVITNNRQLISVCRIDAVLADQMFSLRIVWIYNNAYITEHCFWTCCCDNKFFTIFDCTILHVVHLAWIFLVVYFDVGKCCASFRIPVDDSPSTINQTFVIQSDKNMADSCVESFIHCESFSAIIQRVAKLCPLLADCRCVFFLPFPCAFEELFTSDIIT